MTAAARNPLPLTKRNLKLSLIHIAKDSVGLPDDAYRILLDGAAGVTSAANLEYEYQFNAIMKAFENLGFKNHGKGGLKKTDAASKRNPQFVTARQEYYIRGLWDLASRKRDEASLRRMIKRIAKVSDIRFLLRTDAQKVILALRDITKKAGFDPDEAPGQEEAKCSS